MIECGPEKQKINTKCTPKCPHWKECGGGDIIKMEVYATDREIAADICHLNYNGDLVVWKSIKI